MKTFAIYSPVFGEKKDIPHIFLNKAFTPDAVNCQMWEGKIRTSYGRNIEFINASGEAVGTPDSEAIIKYHTLITDAGTEYELAFTPLHAYVWNTSTSTLNELFECSTGSTVENWSVASFNGKVIATNNVDEPQIWSGSLAENFTGMAAEIASGVTITKAKVVGVFESHVVFGNYQTSDSETYENGIVWSDLDDETNWLQKISGTDAGAAYVEGDGTVCAFGRKNDLFYVYKTRSCRVFWYTGTDLVFSSRPYTVNVGTFAPDSVVNDHNGNLYFYGSDMTFREVDYGIISGSIAPITRAINSESSAIRSIRSAYIPEYNEIWWSIPYGYSPTNNRVMCFKDGIWYERHIAVSAFGRYSRSSSYTWDSQPAGTWADWQGIWDDATESAGWPFDICGDYNGFTYTSHSSLGDAVWDATTGAAVSTSPEFYFTLSFDLADGKSLRFYKRLLNMLAYFTSNGGSPISIYFKQDSENNWQLAGTLATNDSTASICISELPVDYRAKTFQMKISSLTPFEFLGAEFDYIDSGDR